MCETGLPNKATEMYLTAAELCEVNIFKNNFLLQQKAVICHVILKLNKNKGFLKKN